MTAQTSCPSNWQIPRGCCLPGVDLFQLFKHSLRLLNCRQCRVCLMTAALLTDHLLYTDHKAAAYSLTHWQLSFLPIILPTVNHLKISLKLTCGFKFCIDDCFTKFDLLWSGMSDLWMGGAFLIRNMYLEVIQPNCLPTEEMCLLYSQYYLILEENSL